MREKRSEPRLNPDDRWTCGGMSYSICFCLDAPVPMRKPILSPFAELAGHLGFWLGMRLSVANLVTCAIGCELRMEHLEVTIWMQLACIPRGLATNSLHGFGRKTARKEARRTLTAPVATCLQKPTMANHHKVQCYKRASDLGPLWQNNYQVDGGTLPHVPQSTDFRLVSGCSQTSFLASPSASRKGNMDSLKIHETKPRPPANNLPESRRQLRVKFTFIMPFWGLYG